MRHLKKIWPIASVPKQRRCSCSDRPKRRHSIIAPTDILTIAQDASLRATFRQSFRQQINDPELKLSILRYLREVADSRRMPRRPTLQI